MKQNIKRLFHSVGGGLGSLSRGMPRCQKSGPETGRSRFRYFRAIVWGNIACQLFFPLALSFTPAVVAARQAGLAENMSALQAGLGVTPEPVPVLASPSTASPGQAAKPVSVALPDLGSDAADKMAGHDKDETQAVRDERERQEKLNQSMGAAQQLWGILGGPSPRDQGLERATGIASGLANQAAQDWLSQFGNARLSFSTQGTGSADILVPLVDSPDLLLYAQPGIRVSDDRTTGNAGLGARYFMSDWMLGVNTFYDNDFTGNNRRLGVGVEAWRDYLKLSANSYLRLSDWHQSPLDAMQDYDERPANGWDIRAEAYLPSYPQIGGKLMYEHYQGKNVSLDGGTSDLRDNPSAVTFGVNWTPVPLIKVGVDHTTGSGINNTNLTLDFSYRFGVPLSDQLSTSSVDFARSLAGSRYDLVDRNYDIVLQYRKQELISLSLSASGTPYLGESVIITANVNTKYGLDHVVWDAPELLAAGGTLTPLTAGTARVTLPASSPVMARSRAAVTSYTVGAVAYDTHNNESNRATLTLTPERAPQDISSLTVTADNAAANGTAQDSVALTATDGSTGQPLAGEVITLTFAYVSGPHQGKTLPAQEVTTDSNGQAVAGITSTMAGRVSVTATLKRNGNSAATTVTFVADASTAGFHGTPSVSGDNAVADGKSTVTVTFPVTDANGNPVVNQTVTITTTNGASPATTTVTTDENGNATVTVTSTTTGSTTVTATTPGGSSQSQDVNFIAGPPDVSKSAFVMVPDVIKAGGSEVSVLTLTLRDANNNLIEMSTGVSFAVSGLSGTSLTAVTGSAGVYTSSLTGTKAGGATVTPVARGVPLAALAKTVTLTADADTAQISSGALTVTADNARADDTATNRVQVVVTDAGGNPVSGVRVTFGTVSPAHITVSDYATDSLGIATASLASTAAGSVPVTASINGSSQTVNVKFVADSGTAGLDPAGNPGSSLTATSGAKADNLATNTVTATVTDSNGNPVSGQSVSFTVDAGATIITASSTTNSSGIATTTVTATLAGDHTVTATVNGSSKTVVTTFTADSGTAGLDPAGNPGSSLTATSGAKADDLATNTVTATVTDKNGNPVAGVAVSFTTDTGSTVVTSPVTTNSSGIATTTVTATLAGDHTVTATVNGSSKTVVTTFTADSGTAGLDPAGNPGSSLTATSGAKADDLATNTVTATVTDSNGNPVSGQSVSFTVDAGATIITASSTTNSSGIATTTVTATLAGDHTVTATVNGSSKTVVTTFTADSGTAGLDPAGNPGSSLTATSGAKADDLATNTVTATVTDKNGNPVAGVAVSFTTDTGSTVVTSPVTTNSSGIATTTVTATLAGDHTVTATVNGSSKTVVTTFTADSGTADFSGVAVVTGNNAPANGVDIVGVDFTVMDENGNPVPGVDVVITTTNGAQPGTITLATGSNGVVHVDITSTTPGDSTVTASVNGHTQTADVTFIDPIASITVSGEVDGFPVVGTPLTATYTCVTACPAKMSWQWRIETPIGSGVYADIPGATTDSYTPVKGDQIRRIQAIVSVQP